MQGRSNKNLKGIDVSKWQGVIDWAKVKAAGIQFVYIKCTDGGSAVDPSFATNAKAARAQKIPAGAYHYSRPSAPYNAAEPVNEARHFIATMKAAWGDCGDIMPVLDYEETTLGTEDSIKWIRAFVDTVKKEAAREVMLYAAIYQMVEKFNGFNNQLADLPLWVAHYDRFNNNTNPPDMGGWKEWTVWQYSDQGKIDGITGYVDLDAGPLSLIDRR
jgi:GH25 family lysozyme M1 (1,4-beta-N-acetylmuramidase)